MESTRKKTDLFQRTPTSTSLALECNPQLVRSSGIVAADNERSKEIEMAEEILQGLPAIAYPVTKINQWGKHQPRMIKLTSSGIENIRSASDTVSSIYEYAQVISVLMRDMRTFVIKYQSAKHDYIYRSPVAMQIVQEIQSRTAIRKTTDRKKRTYNIALEYQKKLTETTPLYTNISNLNFSLSPPSSPPKQSPTQNQNATRTQPQPQTSNTPQEQNTEQVIIGNSSPLPSRRGQKLLKLLGDTEEQRIESEVGKIALDPSTPEGKAISQFVSEIGTLLKANNDVCKPIRQFMDDVRQHVLAKRGPQLSKLLDSKANYLNKTTTYENESPTNLSTVINYILEKVIIQPHYKGIFAAISRTCKATNETLATRIEMLKNKPQEFYGVRPDWKSPSNWAAAVLELGTISRAEIPSEQLKIILSTSRAIYNSVDYEQNKDRNSGQNSVKPPNVLSADDFLPIFIFVLVNSDMNHYATIHDFLWQLSDPEQLTGEGGYYLTVFSSAMNLITNLDMDNPATVANARLIDEIIKPSPFDDQRSTGYSSSSDDEDLDESSRRISSFSGSSSEIISSSDANNSRPPLPLLPSSSPSTLPSRELTRKSRTTSNSNLTRALNAKTDVFVDAITQRYKGEEGGIEMEDAKANPLNTNANEVVTVKQNHESRPLMVDPLLSLPSRRLTNYKGLHSGTYPQTQAPRPALIGISPGFLAASPHSTSYRNSNNKSNLGLHKIAKIDTSLDNLNIKQTPSTPFSPSHFITKSPLSENTNNDSNNKEETQLATQSNSPRARSRSRPRSISGSPPLPKDIFVRSPRERSNSNPSTLTKSQIMQISQNAGINEGPTDEALSTSTSNEKDEIMLPQSISPTIPPPTPVNFHIPTPPPIPSRKASLYITNTPTVTRERAKSISQIMTTKNSSLVVSQAAKAIYLQDEPPPEKGVIVTGVEKGWVSKRVEQLNQMWRKSSG